MVLNQTKAHLNWNFNVFLFFEDFIKPFFKFDLSSALYFYIYLIQPFCSRFLHFQQFKSFLTLSLFISFIEFVFLWLNFRIKLKINLWHVKKLNGNKWQD